MWQDILENDDIKLDLFFKYSLTSDLVNASKTIYYVDMKVHKSEPLTIYTVNMNLNDF